MRLKDYLSRSSGVEGFFQRNRVQKFAVDECIEILPCPVGTWDPGNVTVELLGIPFELPPDVERLVAEYTGANPGKVNWDKLCLRELGPSLIDDSSLKLKFCKIKYFDARGVHEVLMHPSSKEESLRLTYDKSCLEPEHAGIPHIAVMHAVATTSDNMLVLGLRARRLDYHPHTWSLSFEEQVWLDDLGAGNDALFRAAARGANEEYFGKGSTIVKDDNVRILSLFLQYDVLNLGFCARVEIPVSYGELFSRWQESHPDPEFEDLQSVPFELEYLAELLRSDKCPLGLDGPGGGTWHPSSRYRLLKVMLSKWGYDAVLRAVASKDTHRSIRVRPTVGIEIGVDEKTGSPRTWYLSDRTNSHILVFGISGSGKSTVLRKVISESRKHGVVVVVLDPKGEFSGLDFSSACHLPVIASTDRLPFNPLELPDLSARGPEKAGADVSRILAECCALSRDEKFLLRELVIKTYGMAGIESGDPKSWHKNVPDWQTLSHLTDAARDTPHAGSLKRKLGATLHSTGGFRLPELSDSGAIVQLNRPEEHLAMAVAGLVIVAVYQAACKGRDEYTAFVVDEAHRFEALKDLEIIAREGRHANTALVLATQGHADLGPGILGTVAKVECVAGKLRTI